MVACVPHGFIGAGDLVFDITDWIDTITPKLKKPIPREPGLATVCSNMTLLNDLEDKVNNGLTFAECRRLLNKKFCGVAMTNCRHHHRTTDVSNDRITVGVSGVFTTHVAPEFETDKDAPRNSIDALNPGDWLEFNHFVPEADVQFRKGCYTRLADETWTDRPKDWLPPVASKATNPTAVRFIQIDDDDNDDNTVVRVELTKQHLAWMPPDNGTVVTHSVTQFWSGGSTVGYGDVTDPTQPLTAGGGNSGAPADNFSNADGGNVRVNTTLAGFDESMEPPPSPPKQKKKKSSSTKKPMVTLE